VRILYFADTRFPIERANGVQTMATCHALAERGHDVTLIVRRDVVTPARDPFSFYDQRPLPNLQIHTIGRPLSATLNRAQFLVAAAARAASHPDHVVFTRDLGVASFLLQAPAVRRRRVVYESHGVADVVASELPKLLGSTVAAPSAAKLARLARREARVWRRAASYVTITSVLAEELTTRFGRRERVFVVPDGARPLPLVADGSPLQSETTSDLVVGYAGHLYPWKGVDVLIAALELAPAVRAIIVGGHPAERDRARVEELARTRGVAARVVFTGPVPQSQVAAHLSRAQVLVLPNTSSAISDRYTSPLKLFEYLNLGRAIVASDLPAIREVLTHEATALLVPAGDAEALARALVALAADEPLRLRLARNASALAPEYTWARRAEGLEAALEAAVS
jgi:glycosyltransferase involved in cell wall biosynthesis